jgi:hypothetical protein
MTAAMLVGDPFIQQQTPHELRLAHGQIISMTLRLHSKKQLQVPRLPLVARNDSSKGNAVLTREMQY